MLGNLVDGGAAKTMGRKHFKGSVEDPFLVFHLNARLALGLRRPCFQVLRSLFSLADTHP